jgi:hypothetical protein
VITSVVTVPGSPIRRWVVPPAFAPLHRICQILTAPMLGDHPKRDEYEKLVLQFLTTFFGTLPELFRSEESRAAMPIR